MIIRPIQIPTFHSAVQLVVRFFLAITLVGALPISHAWWGEKCLGDGRQAFGVLIVMGMISSGIALVFVLVGSVMQFATRKYNSNLATLIDILLWALTIGVIVYGGVTTQYG